MPQQTSPFVTFFFVPAEWDKISLSLHFSDTLNHLLSHLSRLSLIRDCWAPCQQLDLSGPHPYGQLVQQSLLAHLTHLIVRRLTSCQSN